MCGVCTIYSICEDGSWLKVWQSNVVKSNLNPSWGEMKIPMLNLCNGDIHRPLRVVVKASRSTGQHVYMGSVDTSVEAWMLGGRGGVSVSGGGSGSGGGGGGTNVVLQLMGTVGKASSSGGGGSVGGWGSLLVSSPRIELHPTLADVSHRIN